MREAAGFALIKLASRWVAAARAVQAPPITVAVDGEVVALTTLSGRTISVAPAAALRLALDLLEASQQAISASARGGQDGGGR